MGVMVGNGTSAQILFGILVSLFYLMLVLKKAPYQDDFDDLLQFFSSLSILLTLQLGFAFKLSAGDEGVYEGALMGILLCVINFIVVLIGLVLLVASLPFGRSYIEKWCQRKSSSNTKISPEAALQKLKNFHDDVSSKR